jgi:hypothetical protein
MIAHPALTDDAPVLGSRSSAQEPRVGVPSPPAVLVDDALATYIGWRDDEREVADAYARWSRAPQAEQNQGFAAYTVALDQEEAAAKDYAESIGQLARWLARYSSHPGSHQPR